MINTVGKFLGKIGELETKHFYLATAIVLFFTAFMIIGITKIRFQSDLDEMNPQDLDVVQLSNEIQNKFGRGGDNGILILIEIDETKPKINNPINDIRDPRVIEFTKRLANNLEEDERINEVFSVANFFPSENNIPETLEGIKSNLDRIPQSEQIFGRGYSFTTVSIEADIGFDEEKIRQLNEDVNKLIEASSPPGGVKTTITGTPALITVMFNFLIQDSLLTLVYATLFIFILLFILTRAWSRATVIIIPLLFGLTWTAGTLGWTETPITIATAGLSAMLLGLGVEYSIFLFSRYEEERKQNELKYSIIKSLETTGAATTSSGLTTIIGFAVLTASVFPVLADLGFSLAIGIAFALTSTMTVLPLAIIWRNNFFGPMVRTCDDQINGKESYDKIKNRHCKKSLADYLSGFFESYGKIVSKKPITIVFIGLALTGVMFIGIQLIQSQDIDFGNVLPEELPELQAFNTIFNERGQTSSVSIFVELVPETGLYSENYPQDIREPEVIEYVNRLTEKTKHMSYFISVNSISELEKEINDGKIPQTLAEQKALLENQNIGDFVSKDFSSTIIRISLSVESGGMGSSEGPEITRQLNEIINSTKSPAGINTEPSGDIVVSYEINKIQNPDTARTSIFALIGIVILLLVLSRSIKYTILPLLTVVLAIFWTLGLIGFFQVPFSSITSSVITMTIGIGIDFGLQLSMRFRDELKTRAKREAMRETLKNVLYPMTITVIAAVIGFSTMRLGELSLTADLGTSMSFSIVSSMLVAITVVAGLILIFERDKKRKKAEKDEGEIKKAVVKKSR